MTKNQAKNAKRSQKNKLKSYSKLIENLNFSQDVRVKAKQITVQY